MSSNCFLIRQTLEQSSNVIIILMLTNIKNNYTVNHRHHHTSIIAMGINQNYTFNNFVKYLNNN